MRFAMMNELLAQQLKDRALAPVNVGDARSDWCGHRHHVLNQKYYMEK